MKIYTKKGDSGETGLYGGKRVPKDDLRIATYGTFDELNAVLGLVLSEPQLSSELKQRLTRLQAELFRLGTELATPTDKNAGIDLLDEAHIRALEQEIDAMEAQMAPLKTFILPGGTRAASLIHLARTVSRRAERELVGLNRQEKLRPQVLEYANRLSDYLFVCARYSNHQQNVPDVPWAPEHKKA